MRFRGTLAARVALLATVAVGLSVAFVSGAAYAMVRHELVAALDDSLLERAKAAAESAAVVETPGPEVPAWVLGAADVRVAFLSSDGQVGYVRPEASGFRLRPTESELAVARGLVPSSTRTAYTNGVAYRVVAVPTSDAGTALILGESLEATHDALERSASCSRSSGSSGWWPPGSPAGRWRGNGLRPVRRLTDAVEEIARTERLDPITVEGNDEVARLATAFNAMLGALAGSRTGSGSWSPTPATSCGHR